MAAIALCEACTAWKELKPSNHRFFPDFAFHVSPSVGIRGDIMEK